MMKFEESDIRALPIRFVMDSIREAFESHIAGDALVVETRGLSNGKGFFLSLSGLVPQFGIAVNKWASFMPAVQSDERSLSTSVMVASKLKDGRPVALVESSMATRCRTAATVVLTASILRAKALIPVYSPVIALIGFGGINQQVAQALNDYYGYVNPEFIICVPTPEECCVVSDKADALGILYHSQCISVHSAVEHADVIISATGSRSKIADFQWTKSKVVVIALDGGPVWGVNSNLDNTAQVLLPQENIICDYDGEIESGGVLRGVSSFERMICSTGYDPGQRLFLDCRGNALEDVALVHCLLQAVEKAGGL